MQIGLYVSVILMEDKRGSVDGHSLFCLSNVGLGYEHIHQHSC